MQNKQIWYCTLKNDRKSLTLTIAWYWYEKFVRGKIKIEKLNVACKNKRKIMALEEI